MDTDKHGFNKGRARHSVRAADYPLTNGGQRTARPTNLLCFICVHLCPSVVDFFLWNN
jgi:hypothetical protein